MTTTRLSLPVFPLLLLLTTILIGLAWQFNWFSEATVILSPTPQESTASNFLNLVEEEKAWQALEKNYTSKTKELQEQELALLEEDKKMAQRFKEIEQEHGLTEKEFKQRYQAVFDAFNGTGKAQEK